jgi:hypothetical protein
MGISLIYISGRPYPKPTTPNLSLSHKEADSKGCSVCTGDSPEGFPLSKEEAEEMLLDVFGADKPPRRGMERATAACDAHQQQQHLWQLEGRESDQAADALSSAAAALQLPLFGPGRGANGGGPSQGGGACELDEISTEGYAEEESDGESLPSNTSLYSEPRVRCFLLEHAD